MPEPRPKKRDPIKQRIRRNYRPGITKYELMMLVFPRDDYPNAFRYSSNGGPPACQMAFMKAFNRMGGYIDWKTKVVHLPKEKAAKGVAGE